MPVGGSIIPGQEQVDEAMQVRQRRKFFEEAKALALLKLQPNEVSEDFKYLKQQQFTWKDDKLEFNGHMERAIPFSFKAEDLNQQDFADSVIERGTLNSAQLGDISEAKIIEAVGNLIQITGVSEVTATSVLTATGVRLTSTIADNADANRIMFAIPEMTAYQTSVAAGNVIPYGSNTINGNYKLHLAPDLRSNQVSTNPSRSHSWIFSIFNGSGSTQDIIYQARYRFIGRNTAS